MKSFSPNPVYLVNPVKKGGRYFALFMFSSLSSLLRLR